MTGPVPNGASLVAQTVKNLPFHTVHGVLTKTNMEQQTGSKSGQEYVKAIYCHPAYLTYMQSTSCEMPGWMKHKLESRLPGEIPITSDTQMTPPFPLDESKRGE